MRLAQLLWRTDAYMESSSQFLYLEMLFLACKDRPRSTHTPSTWALLVDLPPIVHVSPITFLPSLGQANIPPHPTTNLCTVPRTLEITLTHRGRCSVVDSTSAKALSVSTNQGGRTRRTQGGGGNHTGHSRQVHSCTRCIWPSIAPQFARKRQSWWQTRGDDLEHRDRQSSRAMTRPSWLWCGRWQLWWAKGEEERRHACWNWWRSRGLETCIWRTKVRMKRKVRRRRDPPLFIVSLECGSKDELDLYTRPSSFSTKVRRHNEILSPQRKCRIRTYCLLYGWNYKKELAVTTRTGVFKPRQRNSYDITSSLVTSPPVECIEGLSERLGAQPAAADTCPFVRLHQPRATLRWYLNWGGFQNPSWLELSSFNHIFVPMWAWVTLPIKVSTCANQIVLRVAKINYNRTLC